MSPSQNVRVKDLPNEVKELEIADIPSTSWEDGLQNWLKNISMNIDSGLSEIAITKIEKMLIKTALERSNGKKNDAAQILGWGRNTLSKKMKELGIETKGKFCILHSLIPPFKIKIFVKPSFLSISPAFGETLPMSQIRIIDLSC